MSEAKAAFLMFKGQLSDLPQSEQNQIEATVNEIKQSVERSRRSVCSAGYNEVDANNIVSSAEFYYVLELAAKQED